NPLGVLMREVVLVSSVRTPVGRAFKGMLRATRPDELGAVAIKAALERVPQIDAKEIDDVILGCAMPEAEQGMNVARIASLRAGLAQGFGIRGEQADEFSLRSHQKALAAIRAGKFEDETVPVPVTRSIGNGHVGADASSAQDGRGRPSLRDSWKLPRQEIIFKT